MKLKNISSEIKEKIKVSIFYNADFNWRDKHIIQDWTYGERLNFIAAINEISKERVRQIISRAVKKYT